MLDTDQARSMLLRIPREMAAGALSCMIASTATHPLDVVRIKLQTAPHRFSLSPKELLPMRSMIMEAGIRGLVVPGLSAALIRESFYSSIRFGLYTNIKHVLLVVRGCTELHFFDKMVAGMLTGAVGSAVASPLDLVKIRMQHEYGLLSPEGILKTGPQKGHQPRYRHVIPAFLHIYRTEGLGNRDRGLLKGVQATIIRASVLTGAQLASYESAKAFFKRDFDLHEGPKLHVICSIWSGLVASLFAAPADIVKTRLMCSLHYKNAWHCFVSIVKEEGMLGLYRGWFPSYLRLAPHFIISLPLNEYFRHLFGLSSL